MKKLSVLFAGALLSINLFAAQTNVQGKNPFMTRTFPASSIKEVEASTSGGSLILTGDAGSNATVEIYISSNNSGNNWSDEKIKQVLDENYTIDIKVENGKLYAMAKPKKRISNWHTQGLSISLKITAPKKTNSNLSTSGGSIRIVDLSGSQNFRTSGGSLSIENVSGNIAGKTSGGSISVTGSSNNIDLSTSGGSIAAKDCSGKITLTTSGGSIRLNNLKGEVHAVTSGGSISANDFNGTLKTGTSGGSVRLDGISGNVDAHTSGGSMDVKINSASDYVKLSNSGSINLTLPASTGYNLKIKASKIKPSGLKNFHGNLGNNNIEGTVGNGGPEINVKSSQRVRLSLE